MNYNNTNKGTFNYDFTLGGYLLFDSAFSNQYEDTYITQSFGLSYRLNHGRKMARNFPVAQKDDSLIDRYVFYYQER